VVEDREAEKTLAQRLGSSRFNTGVSWSSTEYEPSARKAGKRMSQSPWMIYGATGDTGSLVAQEAVRHGHKPILAGRSEQKLVPLAQRLGLPWVVADLSDQAHLKKALSEVDAVLNLAGPFMTTAPV